MRSEKTMKLYPGICTAVVMAMCAAAPASTAHAQVFDFGQIDAFESLGSGTQKGGQPAKIIVDDSDRHTVLFTVIESNTDAKIYWKSKDGEQTTTIKGSSMQAFQTNGQFRIEAAGDANHSFKYGYVLLRLKNDKNAAEDKI